MCFIPGTTPPSKPNSCRSCSLRNQRFADEYVGSIIAPIRRFQASTDNAVDRLDAQNWMLSQATAAYTIASGPSPYVNVVDMVVLATLEPHGDRRCLGRRAFWRTRSAVARRVPALGTRSAGDCQERIPPDQIAALQRAIIEWRAQNPHVTAISYVHFRDVAGSMQRPVSGGSDSSPAFSPSGGEDKFSAAFRTLQNLTVEFHEPPPWPKSSTGMGAPCTLGPGHRNSRSGGTGRGLLGPTGTSCSQPQLLA